MDSRRAVNKFSATVFLATFAIAWPAVAQSEIYRCKDDSGRDIYTNVKRDTEGKNCRLVSREISVVPALPPPKPAAAKADSPRSREADRRRILEEELDGEQKKLAEAKQRLADQESIRNGNERNYQRVLDRLKPYVDAVEQTEKNISQLRREISNLK